MEKLSSVAPVSPSLVDRLSLEYYESRALLPQGATRTTSDPRSSILHQTKFCSLRVTALSFPVPKPLEETKLSKTCEQDEAS